MIRKKYFSFGVVDEVFCGHKTEGRLGVRTSIEINSSIIFKQYGHTLTASEFG